MVYYFKFVGSFSSQIIHKNHRLCTSLRIQNAHKIIKQLSLAKRLYTSGHQYIFIKLPKPRQSGDSKRYARNIRCACKSLQVQSVLLKNNREGVES
ncbi:hypothetical protein B9Q13_05940 [Candidatus Marsarchaeota G2 archaeon ECH_B_SAG-G16]|uniref:Uncharacterized protein n=3 Tax=Candidatus Marsarchaeota TaxID=1978152 RepID=A0A2R6ABN0_9ARCH|nr:MAG: hypothetical protein B9Q01_03655 [Candidatus Marsarchaeota G1 archaeon OSP_D]PSN88523.1 MAG: hypothetical protein B9Q00_05105 [Candidatus Marsarchaeota G1 archaeon OSP_C]PSO03946.1 MAG: hypothetical protein B9Q13_05940 [Candidatus Marsarchaeota G2 archaeon ECH_B_SAG-G16]